MAKQMTDDALRRQVAQWTRAVLSHLVEDDDTRSSVIAVPTVMRYSRRERDTSRPYGTYMRKKG